MEGRGPSAGPSAGTGESLPLSNQVAPFVHGHMRKRQRSNPGPDTVSHDDMFGGGSWRYSPVSDPDIDYNVQSSKRYLSEVMASNLNRHMSLRPSSSTGTALPPLPLPPPFGLPGSPGDEMLGGGHGLPQPHVAHPHLPHAHTPPPYAPYGPSYGLLTPPGGCSPQRPCASEMSEGLPEPGGEILQPMNTSDASLSISVSQGGGGAGGGGGKASAALAAESTTSETADSELLEERERSVSLSGLLWGPCPGAPAAGTAAVAIPAAGQGLGAGSAGAAFGGVRMAAAAAVAHFGHAVGPGMGSGPGCFGGSAGSPFSSQRRLSEASQGAAPAGPACASLQQQQQQQHLLQQQQQHSLRGSYPRGHAAGGGRGVSMDIPTSPSDTRFGGLDLRKTALLRSISRRAEEATSDGGGGPAAAVFTACTSAVVGFHIGGGGGVGGDSISPECAAGVSTSACSGGAAATATATAAAAGTRVSHSVRNAGGCGGWLRSPGSWSDGAVSDGMSEGGGGGGDGGGGNTGACGGATGMELSSNSGGEGGGGGGTPGTPLDEPLDEQQQQQHHHQEQLLMQQLLMHQPQSSEGSGEARLPGQPPPQQQQQQQQQQQLTGPHQHAALHLGAAGPTVAGGVGGVVTPSALAPAHSCSLGSPPGVATPAALMPSTQLRRLQADRGRDSSAPPPSY